MDHGPRNQIIDWITDEVGGGNDRIKKKRLSATTIFKAYKRIVGKKPRIGEKKRQWHLKKINEELGVKVRKNYQHVSYRQPHDALVEMKEFLQDD